MSLPHADTARAWAATPLNAFHISVRTYEDLFIKSLAQQVRYHVGSAIQSAMISLDTIPEHIAELVLVRLSDHVTQLGYGSHYDFASKVFTIKWDATVVVVS
jgi:hypothetical protein